MALADAGRLPGRAGPMRPRGRPPAANRTRTSPPPPDDDQPERRNRPEAGQDYRHPSDGRLALAAADGHDHASAFFDPGPV
jgi:hypothetical protein